MKGEFILTFSQFLVFRLSSLIFIQTSYVPDEYWQSIEVAHKLVFGYGYLTWEWNEGLRSYFHPIIFSAFYKILQIFSFDFSSMIIILPKILQALLTALSDQYFLLLCEKFDVQNYWIKITIFTNWFWYYCGMRTITNTFETCLTTIALYYYPWNFFIKKIKGKKKYCNGNKERNSLIYIIIIIANCMIRPTAFTIWFPLVLFHILSIELKNIPKFFFYYILPAASITLPIFFYIDYICYGKFIITGYNFLVFNLFRGISSFYGTHPFYWYIIQGLPVVLGIHYIPFIMGLFHFLWKDITKSQYHCRTAFILIIFTIILNIIILSNIPHKEFRFLLPLTPLMELIVIKFSSEFFTPFRKKWMLLWIFLLGAGFVLPSFLFGVLHQRGPLALMEYLRTEIPLCKTNCSLLFLMPCHSTPLYSHLHQNISTKFLTCDPPLVEDIHYDESEDFFKSPNDWLITNWNNIKFPTHIAFFDTIESVIIPFLKSKGFEKSYELLHTIFAQRNFGRYIVVYKSV